MSESNNLEKMIAVYEEKLVGLEPDSEQYNLYNNELSKLKKTLEIDTITKMIDLYKVELSKLSETDEKYSFYSNQIERLENILEQNSENFDKPHSR